MSKPYQTLFLFDMFRKGNILEKWCLSCCNIQGTSPILLGSRFAIILFVSFCITLYDMYTPQKVSQGPVTKCTSREGLLFHQPLLTMSALGFTQYCKGELSRQNIRSCTSLRTFHFQRFLYGISGCAT